MKIMLCTTPIRPVPTNFPPFGSLGVISFLGKHGFPVDFYDIDGLRPTYEEVLRRIAREKPDALGVSAVVSTSYAYVKQLTLDVKRLCPETLVVLGGSLAASAEILLRKTGVDLCVLGEGEQIFLNVCRRAQTTRAPQDFADIPGLALLDRTGAMVNTGYERQLAADQLYDVDWGLLETASNIDLFIKKVFQPDGSLSGAAHHFRVDPRTYQPHRRRKSIGLLLGSKGCVSRCTYCHRWGKGVRCIPVDVVIPRIKHLISAYDLGFLTMGDENFGADLRWLEEFCDKIAPLDLLWSVAGMRVNRVSPALIAKMKQAGCVSIIYGMESGSADMLKVMEKKVALEDNYNAIKWTVEAGINTCVQLVLGMPGETTKTVLETAEFAKYALTLDKNQSPFQLSINFAQALPGTPLYEYGRRVGLIGTGLDEEEAYLLHVSDRNACDAETTLNFTAHPRDTLETWRNFIILETNMAFIRAFGLETYHQRLIDATGHFRKERIDSGYFAPPRKTVDRGFAAETVAFEYKNTIPDKERLRELGRMDLYQLCYPLEYEEGLIKLNRLPLRERLLRAAAQEEPNFAYKSLRKTVQDDMGPLPQDDAAMQPLRDGR